MRSEDPSRDALPVSGNGERALSAPWWPEYGSEDLGGYRAHQRREYKARALQQNGSRVAAEGSRAASADHGRNTCKVQEGAADPGKPLSKDMINMPFGKRLSLLLLLSRVLLSQSNGMPQITIVQSAGAFGGFDAVAPGTWVEIYGSNLAPDNRSWNESDFDGDNAPTSLDGVQVTIGGQKAFISFISHNQVNAQVPSNIPTGGFLPVILTNGGSASTPVNVLVNITEPGLLAPPSFVSYASCSPGEVNGECVKPYVAALFEDGATYVLPVGTFPGVISRPARPGETILLFGIGFGPVTPVFPAGQIVTEVNQLDTTLQVLFDGTPGVIEYAGLVPGFVGIYQIDVVVPPVPDSDFTPISFVLGEMSSSTLYHLGLYTAVQE